MTVDGTDLRHFILGLLAQQPMSGYDIKRFLKGLDWLIGLPSFGSLYPALHALREEGLVTVEVIATGDGPVRKIYSIAETGRQELRAWLERPSADAPLKPFVMRLAVGASAPRPRLIAQLEQRRARVAERMAMMAQIAAGDDGAQWGRGLAMDYGRALAEAEMAWLDRTLARLSPPEEEA